MATVPADLEGPSDADLIDAVRKGTVSAYGSLYERHVASAYNLARQLSRSPAEADDLVSEAFAKVLDTLRGGRGPDSAFRAYLLTALRHTAYDKTRRERKVELSDDVSTASGVKQEAVSEQFSDTAVAGLERSLAARAFARLPERWQAVLWHTEIEGQSPAEVAPILGLTANGVSALAYRAREGLRQAYLQVHLAETTERRCRATAERLGAWTRSGLAKREKAQVEVHLDECDRCRALAAELADVNGAMRGFVAPLVLGIGAAGYLATTGGKITTVSVIGAAAASGTAGGAAGAASAGPRQVLGVAGSGLVLAAAVVVGLAAGGGPQQVPPVAAAEPTQEAPPPAEPAPPAQAPPPQAPPAEQPPAPPPNQEPPPQPAPPSLTAGGPATPVSLVAGGPAVDLPITVRNSGGSPSEPVTATLNLPPGVSAVASNGFAAAPMLRLNAAQPGGTVGCPAGTGTVTCSSGSGLGPGESVTLMFRLQAAQDSAGGEVTGTVSAGSSVSVRVSVQVQVAPPEATDGIRVHAEARWFGLWPGVWLHPVVDVHVRNTGTSSRPVTVSVDQPGGLVYSSQELSCTTGGGTTCTTTAELAPGEKLILTLELDCDPWPVSWGPQRQVAVNAMLGAATDSTVVTLHHLLPVPPAPPSDPPVPDPTAPPSTSPPPHRPPMPNPPAPPTGAPPSTDGSRSETPETPPAPATTPPAGSSGLPGLLDWLLG